MAKFTLASFEMVKLLLPSALFAFALFCLDCASPSKTIKFPSEPPRYPMYDVAGLNDEKRWTVYNVHDPAIVKDGEFYYLFSTDVRVGGPPRPGIQVRRSRDLIRWEWFSYAFSGIPEKALEWVPRARGIWAPDVVKIGDWFYLYYCVSIFGTNRSYIGVARSKSLAGPWEDLGEVVKTTWGDEANAIDPNVVLDRNGRPWLVYGSYFGGIYITPLNPETGKVVDPSKKILLARRPASVHGAVEGAYIVYNPDFDMFYLFVSYDSLFRDYNVRVARSKEVTGPYLDYNGKAMTDTSSEPWSVGTKILGGYGFRGGETWIAPGHCSILKDPERGWFMVHHVREKRDPAWMYLHVRKLVWTRDGWPLVSPQRYAGEEEEQEIPEEALSGEWEFIILDPAVNTPILSETARVDTGQGTVKKVGKNDFVFTYSGDKYEGKVLPSWDWEQWRPTLVFAGISGKGVVLWGKRTSLPPTQPTIENAGASTFGE